MVKGTTEDHMMTCTDSWSVLSLCIDDTGLLNWCMDTDQWIITPLKTAVQVKNTLRHIRGPGLLVFIDTIKITFLLTYWLGDVVDVWSSPIFTASVTHIWLWLMGFTQGESGPWTWPQSHQMWTSLSFYSFIYLFIHSFIHGEDTVHRAPSSVNSSPLLLTITHQ